jgi:CrcB protein
MRLCRLRGDTVTDDRPGEPGSRLAFAPSRMSLSQRRTTAIFVGGAIGALTRWRVAEALPHPGGQWPWSTFSVNIAGALVLAWLFTRLDEQVAPTRYWRLLIGTGFCGALTTFSTFQVETIRLAKDGYPGVALGYATASLVCGMAIVILGRVLARRRRYG